MSSIRPATNPIFTNGIFRQFRQATPATIQQFGQTLAKRSLVQQSLGLAAASTSATTLPANLTAAAFKSTTTISAAQMAAQQTQVLIDAKAGDFFGASNDSKPLVANQTFIGSKAKPSDLNQTQLKTITTGGFASTPVLPSPSSEPTTSNQGRTLFSRSAQMRGLSADELAAQLQPAQNKPPTSSATRSAQAATAQTISKSAVLSKLANMRPNGQSFTNGRVSAKTGMLAEPSARNHPVAAATLGAAAPVAVGAAAAPVQAADATSQTDNNIAGDTPTEDGLSGNAIHSRALRVTDTSSNSTAPVTTASPTAQVASQKTPPQSDFEKGRAAAVKRGDASVGAAFGGSDVVFNKKLAEAWAEVDKAGKAQNFSGPVNWQSFFNILAARNAKLIGMFIELMEVATQLENQTTMDALKLDKESKASNIEFDKAQALLQVSRAIFGLQDVSTANANRIIFNQGRFLTSQELDLQAGLGNRQMQAPVQRTFQRSFVGQLAGDPTYRPLLEDSTGTAEIKDFRSQKYADIASRRANLSQEEMHRQVTAHYAEQQNKLDPSKRILTSYTGLVNGVETQIPVPRHLISPIELEGLSDLDRARNANVMTEVHRTMREDLPAGAQMFLSQIQSCEAAARRTIKPEEKAAFLARAESFREQYDSIRANLRGAVDVANPVEKRFDETIRNRGAMEEIRRNAEAELSKLQAIIEPEGGSDAASAGAREHARAQKAVYQEQVDVLNGKLAILDDDIKRYFDPKGDNRRGRFQSGAEGLAKFYRSAKTELAAAQTRLDAHPNPADPEHQAALRKKQDYSQRLGELESYPAYFKNPLKLHEEFYKRIEAHKRANNGNLPDPDRNPGFFTDFAAVAVGGSQSGLSLEGVSKTRMLTHLRQRNEELANQPDTHPEKQTFKLMGDFWRTSTLWDNHGVGGAKAFAPKLPGTGFVGGAKEFARAGWTNILLRGERNTAEGIPSPTAIPNRPSEQHWLNADGTQGAPVNFADAAEVSRFHSARAATNGNILGMQNEVKGGGGTYRNNSGYRLEHIENVLQNLSQNVSGHLESMESFVTNSAQGLSSDAQESLSEFMSTIAQARQQANGLLLQMYRLANAKI